MVKQLFYVLDENSIDVIPLNGVIHKINANKIIRVSNKFCITQILRHDQTMIDSIKLSQQDVKWSSNETRETRNEYTWVITQDSAKPGSNRSVMATTTHIKNSIRNIIIIPYDVPVSRSSRNRRGKIEYNALNQILNVASKKL